MRWVNAICLLLCCCNACVALQPEDSVRTFATKYCLGCHQGDEPKGEFDFASLISDRDFNRDFRTWESVVEAITDEMMPPEEADQPSASDREEVAASIRAAIARSARDSRTPAAPVRRLTAAEYEYAIEDLTGQSIRLRSYLPEDAAGAAGFANSGATQFFDESTLQRYLDAARTVSEHAVVGGGPLWFAENAGAPQRELAAIERIQEIYREHGFRACAAEGGVPFGMEHYIDALETVWLYQHREALGYPERTLGEFASRRGVSERFVSHLAESLERDSDSVPTHYVVDRWQDIRGPTDSEQATRPDVAPDEIVDEAAAVLATIRDWQDRLAGVASNRDDVAMLYATDLPAFSKNATLRRRLERREDENDETIWDEEFLTAYLMVEPTDRFENRSPWVTWSDARVRYRVKGEGWTQYKPLRELVDAETSKRLHMEKDGSFVLEPGELVTVEIPMHPAADRLELALEVEVDTQKGPDCAARCLAGSDPEIETGKFNAVFLADPQRESYAIWIAGVQRFAETFPQVSHREPAPSDRDPIPSPFTQDDRELFHRRLKYYRDDWFFTGHIASDETRAQLDARWTDLLMSFDYHDIFLEHILTCCEVTPRRKKISKVTDAWIDSLPESVVIPGNGVDTQDSIIAPRTMIRILRDDYHGHRKALQSAEDRHLEDCYRFAERAWRRPMTEPKRDQLHKYYQHLRDDLHQEHEPAIRALLTRILVAPEFLYRLERPGLASDTGGRQLLDEEVASRLSFLAWSSLPDASLMEAAKSGDLRDPNARARQLRRLFGDVRAKRFAEEFFGQWLGIYQFKHYQGIDRKRYPEFDEELQHAMDAEASQFFTALVQQNRPVGEILRGNAITVNERLAEHYGVPFDADGSTWQRVELDETALRGGLMGLGAVLTVTSAPSRTSPVKRGDWILRRVLGTPVPPPPPDAGSISAEEISSDGKSVRERMEMHRRDPKCVNCHIRMDPLGFSLETFDAIGRQRTHYSNGNPVNAVDHLRDGTRMAGPSGLRDYLWNQRKLFYDQLCSKLIGYAFGRAESASDADLKQRMVQRLQDPDAGIVDVLEVIVVDDRFIVRPSSASIAVTDTQVGRSLVSNGGENAD